MSDPEFACALSHSKIYHKIIEREISCAIILENDITISDQLVPFFYNPHLDVLCLAYNAENGFAISQNLMITSDTQTMSCYILKASAISELLDCIRFSVENLSLGGAGFDYAIDQFWKRLQRQMFFALTKDHFARQRPSFSDIEQSHQNYGL
ncbi:MAG: glycosyltransferase family 25 protein [Planktomarina sp.]|nr:glycosyltransferase family 25 protein [Planktomarina sp.]